MRLMSYFIFTMFIILACEQTDTSKDCYDEKPDSGYFHIKVTINQENPVVPLKVYEGKYETKKLILFDSLFYDTVTVKLKVEQYYTFVATYTHKNKIIKAIDGKKIHVYSNTDNSGNTCWKVEKSSVNLTLK